MRKQIVSLSGIAAIAIMIGCAASDNPFIPIHIAGFIISLSWIALLLAANKKG